MNFIVYLLVLLAWAPSFGFAQNVDSPQDIMKHGMDMINKMAEEARGMIASGAGMMGGGGGIPGMMGGGMSGHVNGNIEIGRK